MTVELQADTRSQHGTPSEPAKRPMNLLSSPAVQPLQAMPKTYRAMHCEYPRYTNAPKDNILYLRVR